MLGWTSAIAAYGAFIAPIVIGDQIEPARRSSPCTVLPPFYGGVPGAELVVLPCTNAYVKNPLGPDDEPFPRSTDHFSQPAKTFSNGHGVATGEDRTWEDAYRDRWARQDRALHHGVNCTGSCSWKIYVKGGIVTWEASRPTTRAPAGICQPRAARLPPRRQLQLVPYSANPRENTRMVRGRLLKAWRAAPPRIGGPLDQHRRGRRQAALLPEAVRGLGGFVRSELGRGHEIVAAANVYTIGKYGPTA